MRIAVIDTTVHGPLIGGAQTFLPPLLRGLSARGHEVHLLAKGELDPRIAGELSGTGVGVEIDVWKGPGIVEDTAPRLAAWIASARPDVFVVSTCPDIGWAVLPLLDQQVATVSIAHADLGAYYLPLRHYAPFVSRAVGVSPQICERISVDCSMPAERVDWIPYGVQASPFEPSLSGTSDGGTLRLVYVGRLAEEHKRVSDLARIVKELVSRGTDFFLDIIGDGPMMPVLREAMDAEVAKGKVRLAGWLGSGDLVQRLRQAHVSLLVSDTEGFPIAVVEAMANGCAPIVTNIESGTRQLVEDGRNGFVCEVGDISAFADRIGRLAADRPLLAACRSEAWKTGSAYGVDRMVDRYEDCLLQASRSGLENPRHVQHDYPLMPSCVSTYPLWLRRCKVQIQKLLRRRI